MSGVGDGEQRHGTARRHGEVCGRVPGTINRPTHAMLGSTNPPTHTYNAARTVRLTLQWIK